MCQISTTEFKNNFGKYIKLAEFEEIQVVKRGKVIFNIVPARLELLKEAEQFFNTLPSNASIGVDLDERD